ncbi:MAG: carbon monoxide dehydrogenase, partial [Xanthobacteraceae bacterium]
MRDNGFRVGLAETRDALSVLASSAAARPHSLQSALRSLFCATYSDWEKFDEIFDAFWQRRHMRSSQTLTGVAAENKLRARRVAEAGRSAGPKALPDRAARGEGIDSEAGTGRREGASTAENLATTDLRHITDPAD